MPPQVKTQVHPTYMLPECASSLAVLATQMAQVTKDQIRISETIWGNGKEGMDEKINENARAIQEIVKAFRESSSIRETENNLLIEERKALAIRYQNELVSKISKDELDKKEREERELERKRDIKKWWLGIAAAIIVAVISIMQTVTTQAALLRLVQK